MSNIDQIFKAYDIRGRVGSELNSEVAEKIGKAFGQWLPKKGTVAVGRDMRTDSKDLADALIRGLTAQGKDVIDIGEVTSDMIYFAVGNDKLIGGAIVTASHNPGVYNGIKICREEAKPVGEETGLIEIRDLVNKNDFSDAPNKGKITQKDITEDWISHVLNFVDLKKLKPLKIAVDAGNGMAGKIFPALEPYVPFEVIEMYFDLDGTFPNHVANPIEAKNIVDIQRMVKENKCDAGVAFDGDGDRAVLIDENGESVSGTVMTALLAEYFLKKSPGATILYNAICGQVVPDTIKRYGGKGIRTRVGHSFIKAKMREHNAVFAGEPSGHYFFKDNYMADSGLIAALIGLYMLSVSGKSLSEIAEPFRKAYFQIPEANFEVEEKQKILKIISKAYQEDDQDWLDGLTVKFSDSWFNVRPSNTEPLLRFNAEAKSKDELDKLTNAVTKIINQD